MIDQKLLASQIIRNNMDALQQEALNKQDIDLLKIDNTQNKADILNRQLISKSTEKIVYTGAIPATNEAMNIDLSAYDLTLYNVYYGYQSTSIFACHSFLYKGSYDYITFSAFNINEDVTPIILQQEYHKLEILKPVNGVIVVQPISRIRVDLNISTGVSTYYNYSELSGILIVKLIRKAVTI